MHLRRLASVLAVCLAISTPLLAVSPNVVISQVYGAGGNSGATWRNDYIELFNRGTSQVTLTGWSVQYSSSTGTGLFSANTTPLTGTIDPGQYYLVQESSNAAVGAVIPTPNASGGIAMAAGAGKVVLVNSTVGLACNGSSTPCSTAQLAQIVDLVGYGTGTNFFEGTGPTSTIAATTAAFRKTGGCVDTDNNANDFTVALASPRNTSTTVPPCTIVNNPPVINAPANPITSVLQNAAPFNVSLSGSDDNNIFNWSSTAGTGVSSVVVNSGQGTANISFTVTLINNFNGTATFTASLSDNVNAAVTQLVNITVNAVAVNNPPTITPPANPITTVEQNAPAFTVALNGNDDNSVYNWSAVAGTGVSLVSVTAGQATNHATFTVTLQGGFSGTATFTASLSDNVNVPATQAVNITVTPPPPPPNHLVISQVYGGGGNSGATYQNDFVEIYNPTASSVEVSGWTLQYQAATSTGFWTGIQPLGGTIGPGEYFLVSLASGGAVGAPLPAANIVGGAGAFNMSATAGKIALVSNADTLSNCPFALDADLVDLVGYGTTANCKEGSSNALGAGNTTALFRKNSGLTDTDVNGNDFIAATPNPRRTAPIVEIGPFVVTVDPNVNASTAPRDASITVTFSEAVNVTGNWYNITCASGTHNDATTANTDGGATWVITPNVSFTPSEVCTVTLIAANITDQDLDDSLPNTDTLRPGNKVWSFTIASNVTPPPYASDVHLTMGNPSNAVADISFPNNYLMMKPSYALSYNRDKGTPNWVSWHLTNEWYGTLTRIDTFRPDPAVPHDWYRVQAFDFFNTGFNRGHMTPNADRDHQDRIPINQETYLMSNMVPQAPDNNSGPWGGFENFLRTLTDAGNEVYIVSGPLGVGGSGSNGGVTTTLAGGHVTVPAFTWKVALVLPKADGNDVGRVTAATRTIAINIPNVQVPRNSDWSPYLTTVRQVESLTGYNFFSNAPQLVQNCIELGLNGVNPPCVADQSLSTNEDTAGAITLNALSPTGASLTYTFSAPAHGTLSGSGSNETYTPAPDFNGNDSFTFSVSDGTRTSNTGTVTITVLEVNDSPIAAADAKNTNEDTPLTFAASDLTANDAAGPADEAAQTLIVTSVASTADTHGTLSLVSGQIGYAPDANFNGAASFTYQVCDNGVTVGTADPKCATGTVNITVVSVNDPPTIAAIDNKTVFLGDTLTFTAAGSDIDLPPQTLAYSLGATAPSGASIAPDTGVFSWTPAGSQAGLTFTFDVIVSDGTASASTPVTASVVDMTPPVMSALTLSDTRLWPPNHQMVNIAVDYTVSDLGDASPSCVLTVSSSEPDNGLGDGDTPGDSIIVDAHHVKLRAERAASGNGRIYTIGADCTDRFGNVAHKSATVTVPKDNSK
jgi:endonuclease G, mitochondrial